MPGDHRNPPNPLSSDLGSPLAPTASSYVKASKNIPVERRRRVLLKDLVASDEVKGGRGKLVFGAQPEREMTMGIKKETAEKTKKKIRLAKATVKTLDVPKAKDVKGGFIRDWRKGSL